MVTAPQMRLGYYTQHQMDTLRPDTTVLGEIRRLSDPRTTEEELMSVLGLFLLGQEYFDRQVSKLSGGEKSRLVLASLFLKRCNFLLLDEPTAALDPLAENDIYQKYKDMTAGKTSLFISHRLASTRFCDRIIFVADGHITEEGTHDQLLARGGAYAKLFEVQSRYYQEGKAF